MGKSIPDDADSFYGPILDWLSEYCMYPNERTEITIYLDFFNITSSKRLLFIFYKLAEINQNERQILINWVYNKDDYEMYEVGQDYSIMVQIPFNFIPK